MKTLMMIEPKGKKKEKPINDNYTVMAKLILLKCTEGRAFKGRHTCSCGERSGNSQLLFKGYETNSLLVHYVKYHRSEVPQAELLKLEKLYDKISGTPSRSSSSENKKSSKLRYKVFYGVPDAVPGCNTIEDLSRYLYQDPEPEYRLVQATPMSGNYHIIWELKE